MSSVIPTNKKINIQADVLKSQKTGDDLDNLHVNNWQEKRKRTGMGTLY